MGILDKAVWWGGDSHSDLICHVRNCLADLTRCQLASLRLLPVTTSKGIPTNAGQCQGRPRFLYHLEFGLVFWTGMDGKFLAQNDCLEFSEKQSWYITLQGSGEILRVSRSLMLMVQDVRQNPSLCLLVPWVRVCVTLEVPLNLSGPPCNGCFGVFLQIDPGTQQASESIGWRMNEEMEASKVSWVLVSPHLPGNHFNHVSSFQRVCIFQIWGDGFIWRDKGVGISKIFLKNKDLGHSKIYYKAMVIDTIETDK